MPGLTIGGGWVVARVTISGTASFWAHRSQKAESRSRICRLHGWDLLDRARRFTAAHSFSFAIRARVISWPWPPASRVSMILPN
jgi:hypothetical protein